MPATRAPRDSEAELAVRELPSRGRAAAGLWVAVTAGVTVRGAQRSFVVGAGAPRLFRMAGDDVAAVADTLGSSGGVDERNDFWRNTPGEHDGSTSGEIRLEGHGINRLKNLRQFWKLIDFIS